MIDEFCRTQRKSTANNIGVWFPMVRTGTGTDSFTLRLVNALNSRGVLAKISSLPPSAEYLPWITRSAKPPDWANLVHINSAIHARFIPDGLPVVATTHLCVHDPILLPYKDFLRRIYHRLWIRHCEAMVFRRADIVTAVSNYCAHRTREVFGRDDIKTVHNWIDLDLFRSDTRSEPHDPFRLFFVGKPSRRKGADLLVRIMRELGSGFHLRYTGTESDLVGSGGLPDNIDAIGRLSTDQELVNAYLDCDALLFPSRVEGFGLVALEAQACGRPVIATDASSLPEVVAHGKSGILCPMDDTSAFAAAARSLRDQPGEWHRMARAARRHAESNFAEEDAVARYISIYKDALTKQSTPHPRMNRRQPVR